MLLNGQVVRKPDRDCGFVFQDHVPFLWKTVLGNIMTDLRQEPDRREIATQFIRKMGRERLTDAYLRQLLGGMKQRGDLTLVLT